MPQVVLRLLIDPAFSRGIEGNRKANSHLRTDAGPAIQIFRTAVLAPIPLFFLVLRDAALHTFFVLARQPQRADAAMLFYLLLLYWLLPMLLSAIGATTVADFVLPPFWAKPGLASAVAATQAGIALGLVVWRWRKHYRYR